MKKPSIDLSQEGMNSFFLHHVEKVILGLAIAGLAFFFWNGWSTEKFTKTEPKKLSELATRAKQHIGNVESWNRIAEFRDADDTAHVRIEDSNKRQLNPDDYAIRRMLGTKTSTLGLRNDPTIEPITELVAIPYRAPILLKTSNANSAVSQLSNATSADDGEEGGRGGGDQRGEAGGGLGESGGSSDSKDKKNEDVDPFGDSIPPVMAQELVGFRPISARLGGGTPSYQAYVVDAVAVTGVVNFSEQFKSYESVFKNAIGYYPLRDRPQYIFLEVQRREFDANPADAEAYANSWVDISQQFGDASYGVPQAPEVIDPASYDTVLTRNIPPLVNYDYRKIASHSKVDFRKMIPDALATRNEAKKVEATNVDVFNQGGTIDDPVDDSDRDSRDANRGSNKPKDKDAQIEDVERMKGNNRTIYDTLNPLATPTADYKLVRFFDYRATAGKTYEYRVRAWLNDPNDPDGFNRQGGTKKTDGIADELKGSFKGPSEGSDEDQGSDEKDELEDLTKYAYIRLDTNLQEPEVRTRIRSKSGQELPKFVFPAARTDEAKAEQKRIQESFNEILMNAWSTEWSEPTSPVTVGSNPADFYAGQVVPAKSIRYGEFDLPSEEAGAQLVTSYWSGRESNPRYNTAIPSLKTVRRGDVLNFDVAKAHILDPATGVVKRLKDTKIKTDAVVVDLMGGQQVGKFNLPVNLPSEILVMDGSGNFRLQNSFDDRTPYRHSLFLDDEENQFGKARKKKKDEDRGGGGLPDF